MVLLTLAWIVSQRPVSQQGCGLSANGGPKYTPKLERRQIAQLVQRRLPTPLPLRVVRRAYSSCASAFRETASLAPRWLQSV
jgi:hypothetical protein